MSVAIYMLIFTIVYFYFVYLLVFRGISISYKRVKEPEKEKITIEKEEAVQKEFQITQETKINDAKIKEDEELKRLQWLKDNKKYPLQTDSIKLSLYQFPYDFKPALSSLYRRIIVVNQWIHEPFHTQFYQTLVILNQNNLMIIDSKLPVIKMNFRDQSNQVVTSKSYQVYATDDIVVESISNCLKEIQTYCIKDAHNIIIAICIVIINQSVYFNSKDEVNKTSEHILANYKYAEDVRYIIDLILKKNTQIDFIAQGIKEAFSSVSTEPYNNSEVAAPLQLEFKAVEKHLMKI